MLPHGILYLSCYHNVLYLLPENREEKRRPRYRDNNHGRKESRRTAASADDMGDVVGEGGERSEGTFFRSGGSRDVMLK